MWRQQHFKYKRKMLKYYETGTSKQDRKSWTDLRNVSQYRENWWAVLNKVMYLQVQRIQELL